MKCSSLCRDIKYFNMVESGAIMLKGFVRGLSPFDPQFIVNEILNQGDNCLQSCYGRVVKSKDGICIIQIEPESCLVIKSLRQNLIKLKLGVSEVGFEPKDSCVTILDQLSVFELYRRIKRYYENVLKNCLGKSFEDQMTYLFGDDAQNMSSLHRLKESAVRDSESIIRGLPADATEIQMKCLVIEVIHKQLEYASNARDEHHVPMKAYAEELGNRIWGNRDIQTWLI